MLKVPMFGGALFAACFLLQFSVGLALAPDGTTSPEPRALLTSIADRTDLDTALAAWCTDKTAATTTYGDINAWDTSAVTDMEDLIYDMSCYDTFNDEIEGWDTSSVTTMEYAFLDAYVFDKPLDAWNTESVTTFYCMFCYAYVFNEPLSSWDTSAVTDMADMFYDAYAFDKPLDAWNTESVTTFNCMFCYAYLFNEPLSSWNPVKVTDMYDMFYNAYEFNQPLSWNTKSVTDMGEMFYEAYAFNQPLEFDTSMVENFGYMFEWAPQFNQDISAFDTSSATYMYGMFESAFKFNQDLSPWDVSNVDDFEAMFEYAVKFNQDLSTWDVSNVDYFESMFEYALVFNQVLCWSIPSGADTTDMFEYSPGSVNDTAAKCACVANEYYTGGACVPCPSGYISYGKAESCVLAPFPPTPSPSTTPTTATDIKDFDVSMEMTSDAAPTTEDEADLKDLVADAMEVETSNIKSFAVTWTASGRRRLLATSTWVVSFTVSVALSTTDYSSEASYASFIEEALTSDSFTSAVSTTVGATVDTSSVSVDHDGENDSGLATASVLGIVCAVVLVALLALKWKDYHHQKENKLGKFLDAQGLQNMTAPLHNLGIDSIADLMRPELEAIILKAGVTPDKLATLRAAASGATNTANL